MLISPYFNVIIFLVIEKCFINKVYYYYHKQTEATMQAYPIKWPISKMIGNTNIHVIVSVIVSVKMRTHTNESTEIMIRILFSYTYVK